MEIALALASTFAGDETIAIAIVDISIYGKPVYEIYHDDILQHKELPIFIIPNLIHQYIFPKLRNISIFFPKSMPKGLPTSSTITDILTVIHEHGV